MLSYDPTEGRYNYQPFDNPALKHQPCGPSCDFENTMRAWQDVPRSVKQSASRWVDYYYSDRIWHLHAALPFAKDARRTRKFLQKAILGEALHQGTSSILLVFSSSEKYSDPQVDTSAAEDAKSVSSHASVPNSTGAASRVELSQADIEQMRDWLVARGLSTAKIAQLENLVVKQKESATASAQPQASAGERTLAEEQRAPAENVTIHNLGKPGTNVRFVDDSTAYKSKDWATLANAAPAVPASFKVDKSAHKKDDFLFRPEAYNSRVPERHVDLGIYRGYSPPRRAYSYDNQFGERERTYDIERANAHGRSSRVDDDREYERRLHENYYTKEIAALNKERDELRRRRDLYENDLFDYQEQYRRDQERPTRSEPQTSRYARAYRSSPSPPPPRPRPYSIYERHYSTVPKQSDIKSDKAAEANSYERGDSTARIRIVEGPRHSSRHRSRSRDRTDHDVVQVIEREPRSIRHRSPSSSSSPRVYGEVYPARRPSFEPFSPVPIEREEIIIRRRGSRSRHNTNEYPSYDADISRTARQASKYDEWAFRPRHAATETYVETETIHFPRASSPEELQEDVSDAEDAMLGDAELTNKMMIKYTGGTMLSGATDQVNFASLKRAYRERTADGNDRQAERKERSTMKLFGKGTKRD